MSLLAGIGGFATAAIGLNPQRSVDVQTRILVFDQLDKQLVERHSAPVYGTLNQIGNWAVRFGAAKKISDFAQLGQRIFTSANWPNSAISASVTSRVGLLSAGSLAA